MVRIAIACTSLLGVVLAAPSSGPNYCQTGCQTETPTIWYNCPTPTVPLSVAPSTSPQHIPTINPTTSTPTTSKPTDAPVTLAPSKNPTMSPTSPTKPPAVATNPPSTSPSSATPAPSTLPPSVGPSVSPSVSPSVDEDLAPQEAEPTGAPVPPSAHPSTSPSTSAPSKGPTSPTDSPSAFPSTIAPSAGPTMLVTDPPAPAPTSSPCLCPVSHAAPFKMPLPTYTCPGAPPAAGSAGTLSGVQEPALPVDNPDVIEAETRTVTIRTDAYVASKFPVGTELIFTPKNPFLPPVTMTIKVAANVKAKFFGRRKVTLEITIDLSQLISNVRRVKASYLLLLARELGVSWRQITGLLFRRKRSKQYWGRKASTLVDADVEVSFNLCDTKDCQGSAVAATVPNSVKNLAVYKAAIARTPRAVTFGDVVAALQPGNNINSVLPGMEVYVKVRAAPIQRIAQSGGTAFSLPVTAYWDDIAANPGTSKAAWIYALADFFSPKLNPNQIKNVVMTSALGSTFGRRAGVLASGDGENSQEIGDSASANDDDDSSIIAVAVVVPIVGLTIIVLIVWCCCCRGDDEQDKAQHAPYGDGDEGQEKPVQEMEDPEV